LLVAITVSQGTYKFYPYSCYL